MGYGSWQCQLFVVGHQRADPLERELQAYLINTFECSMEIYQNK